MKKRIEFFILLFLTGLFVTSMMSCYSGHGLSPFVNDVNGTGIKGRIRFVGEWPDSTKEVRIAVLNKYPKGIKDSDSLLGFVINNLIVFSDTIAKNTETYDYFLSLDEGYYEWIVVVWFPDIPLYLFGVRELGAFYSSESSIMPEPVYVSKGSIISGIDIVADFNNLTLETPFY